MKMLESGFIIAYEVVYDVHFCHYDMMTEFGWVDEEMARLEGWLGFIKNQNNSQM